MVKDVHVVTRLVRQITINTGRPWLEFRRDYECAVPHFDRLEHRKRGTRVAMAMVSPSGRLRF
jgi:hypothetical protein